MRAGSLRNVVEIQVPAATRSAQAQALKTWATVATVRGELRTLGGREYQNAGQTKAEASHQMRLRWYPGLLPTHRLLIGARVFQIVSIDNVSNRNREILAMVKEQVQPA